MPANPPRPCAKIQNVNLKNAHNVDDLRRIARRRLPRVAYDYLERGAEDDVTAALNRSALEAIRFVPRALVDVSKRSQAGTVFGRRFSAPFGLAPTWFQLYANKDHDATGRLVKLAVMIDSGFRRGTDVVKALALGADFVFVGRATLYGASAGGEAGAARAIELLKGEIDRTMALLGCGSVDERSTEHLRLPGSA